MPKLNSTSITKFYSKFSKRVISVFFAVLLSATAFANTYTPTTLTDPAFTGINNATGVITAGVGIGLISLRSALTGADNLGGTHTVTLSTGIYTLVLGEITFGNTSQNITINGNGPANTIIDMTTGATKDRIFFINPSGATNSPVIAVSGIKFQNAFLTSDLFGGAAICAGGGSGESLTVTNCAFNNNVVPANAYGGGAICMQVRGNLNVDNCTFTNNSSNDADGGAVFFIIYNSGLGTGFGTLSVTNSTFTGNSVIFPGAGTSNGGALAFTGQGGVTPFNATISNNTFTNNTADGLGGAIVANNSPNLSIPLINFNRFVGNTAAAGAASGALHFVESSGSVNANNNWWGCNSGPAAGPCDRAGGDIAGGGTLTLTKWLQLKTTAATNPICNTAAGLGNTSTITSSFLSNSASEAVTAGNVSRLIGLPVTWSATLGTLGAPQNLTIQASGTAINTFTSNGTGGTATINAQVDNVPAAETTPARASITVNTIPTVTNPASTAVCVGSATSFTSTITGTPVPTITWSIGATALVNGVQGSGSTVSGQGTNTLTITNAQPGDAAATYNVQASNTCGTANSTNATLTVNALNTISLSSGAGTNVQSVNVGTAITPITYNTTGATGATFAFLPPGVTGNWVANVVTISGTPTSTVGSPFNYTVTLTGGACPGGSAAGTITVLAPSTVVIAGSTGTANGSYPSLTNAGGAFEALNIAGSHNPADVITITITADLLAELGTNTLNEGTWASITLSPTGAPRTITGTNTGALIKLNGADRVTINGSTTGASAAACLVGGNAAIRELTIQNTNTGTTACVISVRTGTNGAQNNTIKNVNILGQNPLTTLIGISLGGNTPGTTGADNDNNRVENCSVKRTIFGIYSAGISLANQNTGTVITKNDLSALTTDRIRRVGILVFNDNGVQITENSVAVETNENADAIGIALGNQSIDATITASGGVTNALVSKNKINGVAGLSAAGFSAAGITVAGAAGGANTIQNNMITGVTAPATAPDIVAGIFVIGAAGSDTRVYYNSISITGDRGIVTTQMPSYGIAITGVDPVVELKNNIFYTTQIASGGGANATSYAIGMVTTTFANLNSDRNIFWSTGANDGGFRSGSLNAAAGTSYATLALWQAAVADDLNSSEVDPSFVNPLNNLHLNISNDLGISIPAIADDYDCDPRSLSTPDIGADEFGAVICSITLTSAAGTNAQTVCINTAITNITYSTASATGATFSGLPAGVTGAWAANVVTISGSPTVYGTFNYTVTPTGGSCSGAVTATGTITINPNTWTGATSTNWFTATNWTCGVPGPTTDITIPSGPVNQPLIGAGTAQAHNPTIQGGATLTNNATLNINGGGVVVNNGTYKGSGAFTGALFNNSGGTVAPGNSPGCTVFGAGYTNGSGTELIEIGGTTPCTGYDQLQVTGTATLSGTLNVVLFGGFTPSCGDSYKIMTSTTLSGTFATVNFPVMPLGLTMNILYNSPNPGDVTLTVTGNPVATATPSSQTTCSGTAITNIVLTSTVASTTYAWTRDNTGTVTGIAASGAGNISGTLTNLTNIPITVTFTITPTSGTCVGAPITATLLVNPTPTVNAVPNQVLCNGSTTTTVTFTGAVTAPPGTVYNWTNTAPSIGLAASGSGNIASFTATNATAAPVVATITVTPSYTNGGTTCNGTPISFTITVNPTPTAVATPASQTICSATAITTIVITGNAVAGVVYNWTRDNTATVTGIAASGAGNISGTLTNTTTSPITVTFTITPTANGCPGTPVTATVTVNPTPDVNQPANQVVCNNTPTAPVNFTGSVAGTIFNWTNTAPSIGLAASGTGNIASFTATNAGTAPVVATVTVTPSTGVSGSATFNYTGAIQNWIVPAGVTLVRITAVGAQGSNNNSSSVPAGKGASMAGDFSVTPGSTLKILVGRQVTNTSGNGGGGGTFVTDISNSPLIVAGGGGGSSNSNNVNKDGQITTNGGNGPAGGGSGGASGNGGTAGAAFFQGGAGGGLLTNGADGSFAGGGGLAFINGGTGGTALQPGGFGGGGSGSGFIIGGSGGGYSGGGAGSNSVTPGGGGGGGSLNTGTNQVNTAGVQSGNGVVTITYTGTVCTGTPKTFTYTVNPTPTAVATPASQTICSATPITTIVITGNAVAGVVYNWTRDNTGTVTGIAASGAGNISGTLTNTTNTPITVTFTITPTANGCAGTPITATVLVNPTPTVNAVSNQVLCNGAATTAVTFTGAVTAPPGTVYNWTNTAPSIGLAAAGTGNIASFTATNATTAPVTATITVTPSYTNGGTTCNGTPTSFTITVNPTPTAVATPASQTVCSATPITTIAITGNAVSGVVYNWTRDNTATVTGIAASGAGNISGTLTNTTASPITVTFTIIPTANGCPGAAITATVTVNPTPDVNQPANQVVCNNTPTAPVNFTGAVAGTVFNWTNSDPTIGLAASGSGNIASFTATNATAAPVVATVTVTPAYGNGVSGSITMPAQVSPFSGNTRGYWFTAPTNFTITALRVPTDASAGNQSIAVLRFTGNTPPPVFAATTNAFTTLFLTQNDATPGNIAVSIPVNAGEVIGILGSRSNVNSYGNGSAGITIAGFPVSTVRMGMQLLLSSNVPQSIWQEPFSTNISRVFFDYTTGVSCNGTPKTFTYTVNPTPTATATPATQTICSGSAITTILNSGTVAGTVYNWTRDNPIVTGIAASGTGNISGSLTNPTNLPITVTFTITPSYTNAGVTCTGTPVTATVVVNPIPTVNAVANQVVCNGAATAAVTFSGAVTAPPGTVYNWVNNTTSIGLAASGTGNIASFTATNTGTAPVTATITVTPSYTNAGTTCTGTPITFTIAVNPTATVTVPANVFVCNGTVQATGTYNFSTTATGGVTTYTWTNNDVSIGLGASGAGNSLPTFTATNPTTVPITGTITVTPTFTNGGVSCVGTPSSFSITVNPTPNVTATPTSQTICSATAITTIVNSGTVPGTVFNWVRDNTGTATGIAASGVGNISGTLTNTTNGPVLVTFTITPSYTNGGTTCTGPSVTATVLVNPLATVNTVPNQIVCNGDVTAAVNFTSPTTGGTIVYNWTNNTTSIGLAASGSGNIAAFTATNATNAPVTATITVTPTYTNGGINCVGTPSTFTITVNPTPQVNQPASQVVCNNTATAPVVFTSPTAGTVIFNWTNNTPSIGLAASGTGNIASFTATNATNAPVVATLTVTPSQPGNITITSTLDAADPTLSTRLFRNTVPGTCPGPKAWPGFSGAGPYFYETYSYLNPTAVPVCVTATLTSTTTNQAHMLAYLGSFDAASQATNFLSDCGSSTVGPAVSMAFNAPAGATIVFVIIEPQPAQVCPSYTLTINGLAPTCAGPSKSFTYTVNPTPTVNAVANQVVCHASPTTAVNFTGFVPGTVYNWTNNAPLIGLAASGSGNIASFTANNPGSVPVIATIIVTPSYTNGGVTCTGSSISFTITVNPQGQVNQPASQTVCNGSPTAPVNFTTTVPGTVFNWANNTTSIGLAAAGTGNIASFTATNASNAPVVATIVVTPSYTNAGVTCTGTPKTFTITVNPTPTVNAVANQTICAGTTVTATFSGSVAGTVYNWTNTNTGIGLAASGTGNLLFFATNATVAPITGTITVTPTYTNGGTTCSGTAITFSITVNPTPTVNQPANQIVCAGVATAPVNFTGTVPGTVYNWTNNTPSIGLAASGTGNIASFIAINATNAAIVATIVVTPSYTNAGVTCTGASKIFTITVNPIPVVTPVSNKAYCNGATTQIITFNGTPGNTYNWTNNNTGIGLAASGTGDILPFVTTNATIGPIVATITVTPVLAGCTGVPITFTITVNPTPVVNPVAGQVLCNGTPTAAINFTSPTTGGPTGALSFQWTNSAPSIGLAANGTGNIPSFIAVNTGLSPVTALVTVTPIYTNGGITCTGTSQTFTIVVNPTPTVNPVANQAVCNGSNTAAVNFTGSVFGTIYNWTNNNISIGLAAAGAGNIASFVATNATNVAQVATITVTPNFSNGVTCPGTPITFTITVNPIPTVNPVANQVVCAGETVTQVFSGAVAGTVYNWTNSNTAIGLAASGTGNLNFVSTNTTGAPLTGTITVTPTYTNSGGTCTGTPITFTITVNPIPTVNAVLPQVLCNGSNTTAVNFTGNVPGTVYSWANSNTSIGLAASGTGNIASFTATNATVVVQTATITVTPTYTNGATTCTGTSITFTITVNPTPAVNTIANQTVCAGAATTAVTIAGPVAGTVYSWTNNNPSIGLGASGTNTIPSFTAINATSLPITATITVTPTFTSGGISCTGASSTFTITVNPTANVNQPADQLVCNGSGTAAINFTGTVAGTIYSWTNNNTAIGLAASGTGNIPSFTATNATAAPITATITVTPSSASGCTGTPVSFTITVNPTPSVNAIANQTVCAGSATAAVTISGPVAGTIFTWANDNTSIGLGASGTGNIPAFITINPTINPVTATITVTPTYTNGGITCTGATRTFTITVNPLPNIVFIRMPPRVCLTDTVVTLNATPTGGIWSGPGVSGNTFSAAAAGVGVHLISYSVINASGCTATRTVNIVVNDCLERHNIFQTAIRIWPNPNNGRFSIQFNSDKYKEFKVKVVDTKGREMGYYEFKNLVYGQILPFDLSRLAGGEYFLYVYNTQESGVFPIVIVR